MRWLSRLRDPSPLVLDGATGTRLEALGVDVRNPLWSSVALLDAQGRGRVEQVHREYLAVGAEVLIANSHNLSLANVRAFLSGGSTWIVPDGYRDRPAEDVAADLNRQAVAVARRAAHAHLDASKAARAPLVAGCLASPDRPYATEASLTPAEVASRLETQFVALGAAHPDVVIFEMLTTGPDLEGVAQLVLRWPRVGPVAVGLVAGDDGLLGGLSWAEAWAVLTPLPLSAVFIQCTTVERVEPALRALLSLAGDDGPAVGVYANDGGYDQAQQAWVGPRMSPATYGEHAGRWFRAGARIVGGCCGTGPFHVASIRAKIDSLNQNESS